MSKRRSSWLAENIDHAYKKEKLMKAKYEARKAREAKEKEGKGVRDEKR